MVVNTFGLDQINNTGLKVDQTTLYYRAPTLGGNKKFRGSNFFSHKILLITSVNILGGNLRFFLGGDGILTHNSAEMCKIPECTTTVYMITNKFQWCVHAFRIKEIYTGTCVKRDTLIAVSPACFDRYGCTAF